MLLDRRSILIEVCFVLIAIHAATAKKQEKKEAEEDEFEAYGDYSKHPDYSKLFADETAASGIVLNKEFKPDFGFADREDFEKYFEGSSTPFEQKSKDTKSSKSIAPAPSKKNEEDYPFEAFKDDYDGPSEEASEDKPSEKDYFEDSDKKEEADEEETEATELKPGPHYVSHQIPVPDFYENNEERAQSEEDTEAVPPPKSKHSKKKKKAKSKSKTSPKFYSKPETQQSKVDPIAAYYGGKNVDYNTGKSSSTVSQYPAATAYIANLQIPTTTVSPYGYRPLNSKYLETLESSSAPLKNVERAALNTRSKIEAAPSEPAAENLKKDCRKIEGPDNAASMNCFVCEDANNKAKYTQCSYASSEQPVNQFGGSSIRYSSPVKPPGRYKRSPKRGEYDDDPYFQVVSRNRKYFDDYEKEQAAAESERDKDFHYKPFDPEEYESYSESQSAQLLKEPGACTKVDREGMTCTVCKDPKSGGNFEQCSYTSAPKEKKYAYVAEKKYDSDEDQPEETKLVTKESSEDPQKGSSSEVVPQSAAAPEDKFSTATKSKIVNDPIPELSAAGSEIDETSLEDDDEEDDKKKANDDSGYYNYGGDFKKKKKLVDDDPYDVPEHFAASVSNSKTADGSGEDDGFDEYHYKLFPELNNEQETRNEEQRSDASESKQQDVEEVLAEFAKKDRSNCIKAEKNGMTCFLCVDQNKVQHEECMYIAESKPKPTHIAYHEVQRLKDPHGEQYPLVLEDETKKVETVVPQPLDVQPAASELSKRKKFFKKAFSTPLPLANLELSAAASDVEKTVVPYERHRKRIVKESVKDSKGAGSHQDPDRISNDDEKLQDDPENPENPKEIDVGDEEGAYSHETKPVYSKLYGTSLPKYMVEKTEYEKDFDAASGFD